MKVALIHSVRVPGAHGYAWTWCAEDGTRQCTRTFAYFFECCENARKNGYQCRFDGTKAGIDPDPLGPPPKVPGRSRQAA